MNETVREVYIIMLTKNWKGSLESRVFEAQWELGNLGVPFEIEIVYEPDDE